MTKNFKNFNKGWFSGKIYVVNNKGLLKSVPIDPYCDYLINQ